MVSLLPYANRLKIRRKRVSGPADFIAPRETGIQDYVGCFCVTAGFGADEAAAKYNEENDDYNSIMVKALAIVLPKLMLNFYTIKYVKNIGVMLPMKI